MTERFSAHQAPLPGAATRIPLVSVKHIQLPTSDLHGTSATKKLHLDAGGTAEGTGTSPVGEAVAQAGANNQEKWLFESGSL